VCCLTRRFRPTGIWPGSWTFLISSYPRVSNLRLEDGHDTWVVQGLLGHKDVKPTMISTYILNPRSLPREVWRSIRNPM
jgi:integrase